MNSRYLHKTFLHLETLETRLTPAGDVTGVVVDGTLILTGDAAHNRIEITQIGSTPGAYRVRGTEEATWGETTVNGLDEDTFSGVTSMKVKLNDGKDFVWVNGDPQPLTLLGYLKISTHNREDNILVNDSTIEDKTTINSGPGSDTIQIIDSTLEKALKVTGDNGGDLLGVFGSAALGTTEVAMGEGFDTILFGSDGFDLDGTGFAKDVTVDCGAGENTFESYRSDFDAKLTVTGGDGSDIFLLTESTHDGKALLKGSSGGETMTVRDCTFSSAATFNAGGGGDLVEIFDTLFAGSSTYKGGAGDDLLDRLANGNTFTGPVVEEAFETVT